MTHRITLRRDGAAFEFVARHGQTVLDAALAGGVDYPFNCRVGACGTCLTEVLEGDFRCRVDVCAVQFPEPAQNLALACQTVALSDLTLTLVTPTESSI